MRDRERLESEEEQEQEEEDTQEERKQQESAAGDRRAESFSVREQEQEQEQTRGREAGAARTTSRCRGVVAGDSQLVSCLRCLPACRLLSVWSASTCTSLLLLSPSPCPFVSLDPRVQKRHQKRVHLFDLRIRPSFPSSSSA